MDRVWTPRRLRWRMRGAWQWPVFAVLVVVDAVLLHALPIAGDGPALIPALLLAGFFSLVTVAVLAPLAGWMVRRRRRDLPDVVASDYAGAALLAGLTVVLVLLGLAHRGDVQARRDAFARGVHQAREYVAHTAPAQYRRHVDEMTSLRFDGGLYRMCVPGDDATRSLCLFVDTAQNPPGLRRDTNPLPNASYLSAGAGPGRGG
jgi:hypothetical protein